MWMMTLNNMRLAMHELEHAKEKSLSAKPRHKTFIEI
jgi:hypothetical protein